MAKTTIDIEKLARAMRDVYYAKPISDKDWDGNLKKVWIRDAEALITKLGEIGLELAVKEALA